MKIVVLTDAHANLPALQAALSAAQAGGYDAIYHTGDAISIGPFPAECLDLMLSTPGMRFVMGNHDAYFANGLPDPRPAEMDDAEAEHHRWTHACLEPSLRSVVASWPYLIEETLEGVPVVFLHYALDASGRDFLPVVKNATPADMDGLFAPYPASLLFYGHHHRFSDMQGLARYVNPGALGAYELPLARYDVVELYNGAFNVQHCAVSYDDAPLIEAFRQRRVPDTEFILPVFFGGRFSMRSR